MINAFVHRDYFDFNGDIAVEKLADRIFINNPGGISFPDEEFGVMSYPRNRLIADLLSRTSFMEKAGTGIKRMRRNSAINNNKLEIDYTESFYLLNIYSNQISDKETTQETTQEKMRKISTKDKIIENLSLNNGLTKDELAEIIGVSSNAIKQHLAN